MGAVLTLPTRTAGMDGSWDPGLRLVSGEPVRALRAEPDPDRVGAPDLRLVGARRRVPAARRRVSPAVRRRRLLVAVVGLLVLGLALPLGGTGGRSQAAGPGLAASGRSTTYTVQAGDTLWSIAERIDPTGDPRPMVARLAAQTGSETVVPGERINLP